MKVKFKNANTRLQVNGIGVVTSDNLTPAIHKALMDLNPLHADLFDVEIEKQVKSEPVKESSTKP